MYSVTTDANQQLLSTEFASLYLNTLRQLKESPLYALLTAK